MRNTKLKVSTSKNKIKHKRRRTMKTRSSGGERKRDLNKETIEVDEEPTRKSRRNDTRPEMLTKPLGSGFGTVSEEAIEHFINDEISDDAPQIVSLPVPPERHAFLVHVKKDAIWISDWGGGKNLKQTEERWENYTDFMRLLTEKYDKKIKFYTVDKPLYRESFEHHETCNDSGGCSHYIYKWVEKHYSDYVA